VKKRKREKNARPGERYGLKYPAVPVYEDPGSAGGPARHLHYFIHHLWWDKTVGLKVDYSGVKF
jgi:hypothetical protein